MPLLLLPPTPVPEDPGEPFSPGASSGGPGERGGGEEIVVIGHRLHPTTPPPEPPIVVTAPHIIPLPAGPTERLKPIPAAAPNKPEKNFCGPEGGATLPNSVGGASINDICHAHDLCYSASGTPRSVCDERFAIEIFLRSETKGSFIDPSLRTIISIIGGVAGYTIVWLGGKPYYVPK